MYRSMRREQDLAHWGAPMRQVVVVVTLADGCCYGLRYHRVVHLFCSRCCRDAATLTLLELQSHFGDKPLNFK